MVRWTPPRGGEDVRLDTSQVESGQRDDIQSFVQRYSNVDHITGRGDGGHRGPGPLLMAWPDMQDMGKALQQSHGVTGICIIEGVREDLSGWVAAMNPEILGTHEVQATGAVGLPPVVVEELEALTLAINHNNTISAGSEKTQVVSALLRLHVQGVYMDASAIEVWALAHGWVGKNPSRLAEYVTKINSGTRPRTQ